VGCDVAWKAEAGSPLTGKNLETYRPTHVRRSAFSQIKIMSCHIMVLTSYFRQLRNYLYNRNFWGTCWRSYWAYNRLQAHYSLGGYSHREHWTRTRWTINSKRKWMHKSKGKDEIYYTVALQDWRRRKLWAYIRNFFLTIASGATPIGGTGCAPDEDENIISNAGVKIDFIIGGKHLIINLMFHSHREGFTTSWESNPMISGTEIAKQGSR
jgi:hypothetical protein